METSSDRRRFLTQMGMAGAAVGAGAFGLNSGRGNAAELVPAPSPAAPSPAVASKQPVYPTFKGSPSMLDKLSRANFAQHLGSTFRVTFHDENGVAKATDLKLAQTDDCLGNDPARGYEAFSLIFTGPASAKLEQNTYQFAHPHMGKFPIFIVPIGESEDVRRYEAIFSRLARA